MVRIILLLLFKNDLENYLFEKEFEVEMQRFTMPIKKLWIILCRNISMIFEST